MVPSRRREFNCRHTMCARFAAILFFSGRLFWFAQSWKAETPAISPQQTWMQSGVLERRGHLLNLIEESIYLIF